MYTLVVGKQGAGVPGQIGTPDPELFPVTYTAGQGLYHTTVDEKTSRLLLVAKAAGAQEALAVVRKSIGLNSQD